jgi:ABC-type antimicrobial peptide transport system permease subunit
MRLPPITLAIFRNRHKLAFVGVFAAITVFLIITTLSLTQYVSKTDIRAWGNILQKVTILIPTSNEISDEILQSLSTHAGVKRVLPFFDNGIRMPGILASEYRPVIALRDVDIPFFLNAFDLQLIEGDLPKSGSREILLSKDISDARGLKVGDHVGNAIDDQEILWGRFTISGVLDDVVSLGIASYEYYQSRGIVGNSILLFSSLDPSELNDVLEQYTGQFNVESLDTFIVRHNENYRNFERLMIILAVILIASSQAILAIFIYLYLVSRKREFGLFLFRGVSRAKIALFVVSELAFVAVFSWVSGLILSVAVLWFIRTVLFDQGVISVTVSTQSVLLTVPMVISFVLISGILVLYIVSRDKLESTMIGG